MEKGAFGPRLRASVVTLAVMLMSRRTTLALLKDMFGAKLSVGSIDNILKQAGELLASPWQAIQRAAQSSEVLHADETSWRRAGQRIWLWAALSATACCFRDRKGTFEPKIVRKRQRRFQGFDDKIIVLYSRGLSVRDIQVICRTGGSPQRSSRPS